MKNTTFVVSVVFAAFVLLASAFAQTGAIRVTVPFDFTVGKQTLAAGEYSVTVIKPGMLQVQRVDGAGTADVLTTYIGGGPSQDRSPRLIFHSYNNHYFLSQIWIADVNPGHELFASASELQYARRGHQSQTTLVAQGQPGK
jgi:hypothetical protein